MPVSSVLVWQLPPVLALAALVLGYVLGSIPFGILITRFAGTTDIRTIGSGNIGATNVLRTGRKDLAALTLLGDALKGTVAVLIARWLWGADAALVAGLGAFLGHLLPVWLKFKGGKGVATFLGIALGLYWPLLLVFAATWLGMAFLFRYSSLAALTAAITTPIAAFLLGGPKMGLLMAVLAVLLWIKHHQNISRLLAGTETKIGAKG
ncbi:glycerol-3-phosphate acyltransferase [Azorhizobium oxalatiphilum]|uniref:Glycerol-3-phosphate acyltransferase n=1 Tax=Azorhizobium oxalatiphilum TaxID=980631 RepID=A0A917F9G6_9HYPH|nr:glycerol-3-phosphate 1-O-acyltransferase PlsY [Azorhizobium oxalatiphilum]GGF55464.1 glycerol-3-phosphate acyltransferase [Azorhizobium oxalatiphilum]